MGKADGNSAPSANAFPLQRGSLFKEVPSPKTFPLERGSLFKEVLRISKMLGPADVDLFLFVKIAF